MKFSTFRKANPTEIEAPGTGRGARGVESEVAALNQRLNELTAQLDRIGRLSAAAAAPVPPSPATRPEEPTSQRLSQAITRLDQRLDHLIAEGQHSAAREQHTTASDRIDQAVAEIAARQRALDAAPAAAPPPRQPEPARAPGPAQDLTGLEQQLRQITEQMQAIHRPCTLDDSVTALRTDLAAIGRTLTEAMPRQAVEALEGEVRALKERVDERRHNGADASAIAGIERGLAEVRDALRSLTPAESLTGFDEAVRGLSRKIDQIVATSQDPRALQQLETAISGLRTVVSRVASDESLARLSEEVRGLSTKIEHIADAGMREGAGALSNLEQQVATLAHALEAGVRGGQQAVPPRLEALMKTLTDKIDQMELSRGDRLALGALEDRIVRLVEKLDANDSRLGHLGAIERGLADLLIKLDDLRPANGQARAMRDHPAPAVGEVSDIKRDIVEIKQFQTASEQRAKETLHAVHGTLGEVFDRLAVIETDLRKEPATRAAEAPPAPQQPPKPAPAAAPPPAEAPKARPPQPNGQAVASAIPDDYPLEPGSGTPRGRAPGSPADRIAASEAVLATSKPPQADTGNSNFVMAARRAAQAAGEALPPPRRAARVDGMSAAAAASRGKIAKGLKSVVVAVSVVIIVLGAVRVATNFLSVDHLGTAVQAPKQPAPPAKSEAVAPVTPAPAPAAPAAPGRRSALATPDDLVTTLTPPSGLVVPDEPQRTAATPAAPPAAAPGHAGHVVARSIANSPEKSAEKTPDADATGSFGRVGATPPAPAPAPAVAPRPVPTDKVPAAVTSPALRAALAQGDPTAEYELALRYSEGRGVPQSLEEAARWFDRAAKSGLAPAQFRLGSLYEKGHGVKKDIDAARQLYVAAAEKGNAKSMHNLAVLHAEGVDGKPDYKSAAQWFRKAAAHGVGDSQYNLGILYARGIGVEQNLAESFKWFALAAAQGDTDAAKKREDVAARLDAQSLMAAKHAVQTWVAEPQPEIATTVKTPAGGWDKAPAAQPAKPKPRPAASKADPS
jgi:localization factor PodJL